MSLGSGETTVLRMVSAYAVFANGGKQIKPSLIDRIQDRYGKTIFSHDERICEGCNADDWENQDEPELIDNREQVLDPMTAYQITSMMEGVVSAARPRGKIKLGRAGRRQDRHDQRREGRLVRRLHAGPRRRPLYRLRQPRAARPRRDRRLAVGARSSTTSCRPPPKARRRSKFLVPRGHEADRRSTARPACRPTRASRTRSWRPSSPAPARPTCSPSSAARTYMEPEEILRISPQANQAVTGGQRRPVLSRRTLQG